MFKKLFLSILILCLAIISFAAEDIVLPVGIQRIYQIPLDTTAVFTNHESAATYAANGADGLSSAYKGQYLSIPDEGVFYIDNDWNLKPAGGIQVFAGQNVDSLETTPASELYFKIDYSDRDYTTITNLTYYGTNYPTLLIPSRGERGFDGATNLMFGGYWDPTKAYENTNVIVAYEGNVYINIQPVPALNVSITNDTYWQLLVSKGDKGDSGTILVGEVKTGNPGTSVIVTNVGTINDAIFNFTIPRGDVGPQGVPGVDLAYDGTWIPNKEYRTNTLVRHLTNVWYTETATTGVPGESEDWEIFLMDGKQGPQGVKGDTGSRGPKGDPGTDGGQYRFMVGWDKNFGYNQYDICIVSNDFYLCNQSSTNQPPWNQTYQQEGVWTKLISPNYKYYGLSPSRYYSASDTYVSNELVRYDGSTYVVVIPEVHGVDPTNENAYAVFAAKGDEGPMGPAIYPEIESITMLEPSAEPTVETRIDGTNAYYSLGIPRGQRGSSGTGNLIYYGQWEARTYDSNSLVRFGTNLWYTEYGATGQAAPPTNSSWDVYLSDGRPAHVTVDPEVDTLNPGQAAHVIVTDEGYNDIGLKFQIPKGATGSKGDKGDRGPAGAAGVGNMWFDGEWVSTKQYPTNIIVASSNDVYGDSLYVSIVSSSNVCPVIHNNWNLFWKLLVSSGHSGENGGLYRFMIGWDGEYPYQPYDVCVISNNFYLCNKEDTINKKPWVIANQTDGTWTKLISPDYRFYGLSPSRYYNSSDRYVSNELVRWKGSTYVVTAESISGVEPNDASDAWAIFAEKGEKGDTGAAGKTGDIIYPHIENISMLEPEAVPTTSSRSVGTNVYYTFGIPRGYKGEPGANLVFYGDWNSNETYNATSLVKHLTNTWYSLESVPSHIEPGTLNSPWKIFTSDGMPAKVSVVPEVNTVEYTNNAHIEVETNDFINDITLTFTIPKGRPGDVVMPFVSNTITLYPEESAWVTNETTDLTTWFSFGIPQGKPGANLTYLGDYDSSRETYPSNSLVKTNSVFWYSTDNTQDDPSTNSSNWKLFWKPTTLTVATNGETLDWNKNPQIVTNYDPISDTLNLSFKLPRGKTGDIIYPKVQETLTVTNQPASVSNRISGTNSLFYFKIPKGDKGDPGIDLHYSGKYDSMQSEYPSNTMVQNNRMYWYSITNTTEEPSYESEDWKVFWKPMQITVSTNGTQLEPNQNPQIVTNYDAVNDVLNLLFKIPRGNNGITKTPIPGNSSTLAPISTSQLAKATVTLNTALSTETTSVFDFGIPGGLKGDKGDVGDDGKNAIIAIGEVTNVVPISTNEIGQATVSILTNEVDNIYTFSFGIPEGLQGPIGEKGIKGDNGVGLVPKGVYISTNTYYTNELVRFANAQYYVNETAPIEGIIGIPPDDETYGSYWSLFLEDGQSIAGDATTLISINESNVETQYLGKVLLDTNTLIIVETNINSQLYNALTVVGGPGGGGSQQWEIDIEGNLTPAAEMFVGQWDYDANYDIMPPPIFYERGGDTPVSQQSRIIEIATGTVLPSDYIIWMDSDSAGEDQTLTLPRMLAKSQTIIVRQLGDSYGTTIQHTALDGTMKEYTLRGDGDGVAIDWLGARTNWYWRNY